MHTKSEFGIAAHWDYKLQGHNGKDMSSLTPSYREPSYTAKSATVGIVINSGSTLTMQNITGSDSCHTNTHESNSGAGHPLTWDNTYVYN